MCARYGGKVGVEVGRKILFFNNFNITPTTYIGNIICTRN